MPFFHILKLLLCFLLLSLFLSSCQKKEKKYPEATQGYMDISSWNFEANGNLPLNGEWSFYWQKYLRGTDFNRYVSEAYPKNPMSWTDMTINGKSLPSEGHATYRLKVFLPHIYRNQVLAIRVGIITSNYALIIQNRLLNSPQYLGTTKENTDGYYNPDVYYFTPQRDSLEIVMHIANFNSRFAGMTSPILLGKANQIRKEYDRSLMINFSLLGILWVIGGYHLSLYLFRKKNISTLYFSIYCFIIGIRILVIDDYYLTDLFPSAPFELGNKLSYLTFYLGVPSLAIFVHSLYPEDFSKYVVRGYMFLGGVFSLIVLFSKSIFYAEFLIYYQLATLLIILYSIYFIVLILLRKREGSMTFTIGILTIFITATNDILYSNLLIQTTNIIPFGLFVFIFSQTLILSKKFSLAFNRVEELSEALQKNNDQLEEIVGQRTAELNELNLALAQNLEELRSNIDMINTQNKEIKAQHHSITSSINYAKNIQSNILPDFQHIQAHFPDSFLIFRAKDIVSGDFYYFNQKQNKFVLAAVDCTGHGVPGAFMSLIGYEILTEIIEHYHLMEPSHILKRLHLGIKKLLKQGESTSNSRDGMDIALVVIDMEKKELLFAGAKTPLVYIENGKMKMIDGDNLHIGGINSKDSIEFQQTTLPFGDKESFSFYLFSDGYQDQFGGEQNKKLMKRHFRELLFQLHAMPMKEQGDLLLEWHEAWKGNIAQTDDILVMGLRLK